MTVSYTHLDVYKRQGHDDARDEVQRAQETAAHHTVFPQGGVHGGHNGVCLLYTSDVYKRQSAP